MSHAYKVGGCVMRPFPPLLEQEEGQGPLAHSPSFTTTAVPKLFLPYLPMCLAVFPSPGRDPFLLSSHFLSLYLGLFFLLVL